VSAAVAGGAGSDGARIELSKAGVAFTQPEPGATLHGGDLVEIRWSGVPPEADEVELLLSVDGGRHFSLRLTEELDARSRSFLWRVPDLAADGAALAVRMGIGGREIESVAGPLFNLRPERSPSKALLQWRSEEIWLSSEDDDARGDGPLSAPGLTAQPERMTALPRESGAFVSPRTLDPRPALLARGIPSPSGSEPAGMAAAPFLSRSPHSIPQRI
jgi:hypothetical protein